MKNYRDIRGGDDSGIIAQLTAQRGRIVGRLSRVRQLLFVGSGKGGVGKSTVTAQLALSFRRSGLRVGILDADLNGPTVARLMGVQGMPFLPEGGALRAPQTKDSISIVSFGAVLQEGTNLEFESVAKNDAHTWRATKEFTTLAELLESIEWGALDVLLVDLPPGPERTVHFCDFFSGVASAHPFGLLLVTQPTEIAHGVVARSIAALADSAMPILGYVENMDGYLCPECHKRGELFSSGARTTLSAERLGGIPFEPALSRLCDEGLSVESWGRLASRSSVEELANAIFERIGERGQ